MGTFPQQLRCRTIISLNLSDCNLFSQKSPKKASGRVADFKVSIEFICFSKKSCHLIYFQPNGIIPSASSPINQTVSHAVADIPHSSGRDVHFGCFFLDDFQWNFFSIFQHFLHQPHTSFQFCFHPFPLFTVQEIVRIDVIATDPPEASFIPQLKRKGLPRRGKRAFLMDQHSRCRVFLYLPDK